MVLKVFVMMFKWDFFGHLKRRANFLVHHLIILSNIPKSQILIIIFCMKNEMISQNS